MNGLLRFKLQQVFDNDADDPLYPKYREWRDKMIDNIITVITEELQ